MVAFSFFALISLPKYSGFFKYLIVTYLLANQLHFLCDIPFYIVVDFQNIIDCGFGITDGESGATAAR
jgi:hypothetical protein